MKLEVKCRIIIRLLISLLFVMLICIVLKKYLQPIIIMMILVLLIYPLYNKMSKKIKYKRLSILFCLFIINFIFFMIVFFLGHSIVNFIDEIVYNNLKFIQEKMSYFTDIFKPEFIYKVVDKINLKAGAMYSGKFIVDYFIGNICCYLFLLDKDKIINYIFYLMPIKAREMYKNKKYIVGKIIKIEAGLVIMNTILIIIGFIIFKIPYSFILGVICGIVDVLPYVGTIIVFIPIIVYNIILRDYVKVIGLISLFVLLKIIRELIEYKLLGQKLELHPFAVIISVYLGIKVLGLIGVFAGPAYCILAKEIIICSK